MPTPHAVPSGRLACWQPSVGSQVSAVQSLRSSQTGATPATQTPALQISSPLQTLPSEHEDPSGSWVFWQAPLTHASLVHGFVSSQSPFTLHGLQPGIGVKMHPLAGPQLSVVQASPSSQVSGVPRVHVPAWHVSSPLQTSASAHDVPSGTVVFWQTPPTQASPVHGFPSMQSALMLHDWQPAIGVWMQPVSELHVSVVHALPSSQESGVPAVQVPLWQVSFPLQTS